MGGTNEADCAARRASGRYRLSGVPNGSRTRVLALKGPRPGPLDDGDVRLCAPVRRSQRALRCTSSSVTEIPPITKAMYLIILALVPILFLFNPLLALAGLVAA